MKKVNQFNFRLKCSSLFLFYVLPWQRYKGNWELEETTRDENQRGKWVRINKTNKHEYLYHYSFAPESKFRVT